MVDEAKLKKYYIPRTRRIHFEIPEGNLVNVLAAIDRGTEGYDKSLFRLSAESERDAYYISLEIKGDIPKTDEELEEDIANYEKALEIRQQEVKLQRQKREKAQRALYTRLKKKYEGKK